MRALPASALILVLALAGSLTAADPAADPAAGAGPRRTELRYEQGGASCAAVLFQPAAAGPAPGVLVLPEWWGLNEYAQRRARELAERGFAALAVDLYGDGRTTTDPAQAGALSKPFRDDRRLLRARAGAALALLRGRTEAVDPARVGAIGFCFGGTAVLELARSGAPLVAGVALHAGLDAPLPADPGTIAAELLVLHGGADPLVPPPAVAGFLAEMDQAKARYELVAYGGAVHAFTNPAAGNDPARGVAHNPAAERAAMARTWDFLRARLVAGAP